MRFPHIHKIIIVLFSLLCLHSGVRAQGFSYVYIQGDKQIPFYVKFEGEMLPRYGKNYSIIPMLAPGPIHIEILYEQNRYPAQKYVIQVPENGYRGFLLLKRNNIYALYDIQQQFYLHSGNKAEDDHAPTAVNTYIPTVTKPSVEKPKQQVATIPQEKPASRFIENVELSNEKTVQKVPVTQPVIKEDVRQQKVNIANTVAIEEEMEHEQAATKVENKIVVEETPPTNLRIINSDCPNPINNDNFEDILDKAAQKSEKSRLKYLLDQMEECYTTAQARILAKTLSNDPERYTFLKRVYSRITDQSVFPELEALLSTQEWKSYFKLILPQK